MTCAECKFFVTRGDGSIMGWCRRFPRQVDEVAAVMNASFPSAIEDEWCGEFQPKTDLPDFSHVFAALDRIDHNLEPYTGYSNRDEDLALVRKWLKYFTDYVRGHQ